MPQRVVLGELPGGGHGLRVSRPGFDVIGEPYGSRGIAFDSRLTDFGIIHQQGVVNLGTTFFPDLAYVPLVTIHRIGDGRIFTEDLVQHVVNNATHFTIPYVGIITTNALIIQAFTNPYYTPAFPGGVFLYTVFRIET